MAVLTYNELKVYLGLGTVSSDVEATYTVLMNSAISMVESYIGMAIEQHTVTEYLDGNGSQRIRLKERPVISVSEVNVDSGRLFAADTELDTDEYYLDSSGKTGILVRLGNAFWPNRRVFLPTNLSSTLLPGEGNIKVVYSAGYATVPNDLKLAVALITQQAYQSKAFGQMLSSESHDGYSYTLSGGQGGDNASLAVSAFVPEAARILAPYRPLRIV